MKILIVDDEAHCTDHLLSLINKKTLNKSEIDVCNNSKEALKLMINKSYDLVFLDIEMPFLNGFDLLETIPEINFHVIFTTAFDKYALKAIKFSALDYLLKPIEEEEFYIALDKFLKQESKVDKKQFSSLIDNVRNKKFNKIAIPSMDGIEFVEVNDIIRCKSDSNYTRLFLVNKREIISSKTLKEYELLLKEYGFSRVHNSDMINLAHIKKYIKGDGGQVIMNDGSEVEVSRRRKEEFLSGL
jgi:two-component system LytT family response regulator